jgi:hypothetical protein
MADAAMWGDVYTVTDNAAARVDDASGGVAYVQDVEPGRVAGIARGHMWAKKAGAIDPEPRIVWVIVVGSIVALFLFGNTFKSARA